jgi:nucleoid-associated protein YgaU
MLGSCFSILLILLGLYFFVNGLFGIVNQGGKVEELATNPTETDNAVVNENVAFDNSIKDAQGDGNADISEGISTYRVKAETSSAIIKAANTKAQIEKTHKWRATDYEKGDIGIGEYEVKLGDTLWEIAEAVYGSGFEWKKILDTNSNEIGYLPNGSHALIVPGQILIIAKG